MGILSRNDRGVHRSYGETMEALRKHGEKLAKRRQKYKLKKQKKDGSN